ncbi:tetratricopeptide repeat protein [Chelatococcus sp. GCM10030263]|uniref:tetratricopeptide repeat protein n=1 Tax=Chelatococcus sp. GCM10030263 TaxID=3273387 RepID=UPI003622EF8D
MALLPPLGVGSRSKVLRIAACLAVTMLGGCMSSLKSDITASIFPAKRQATRVEPTQADWRELAEKAGRRYEADPGDKIAALAYGRALREIGQHEQAAAVLRQAVIRAPGDKTLLAAYGKALIDVGNFKQAGEVLARAHTPDNPDWSVLSAQGTVADQLGDHEAARRYYLAALRLAPGEPTLLSNLGLSYALSRDLPQAERALRQAAASPKADDRVRQNLALVLSLEGKAKEAATFMRSDMPPEQLAEALAYFKSLNGQSSAMTSRLAQRSTPTPNLADGDMSVTGSSRTGLGGPEPEIAGSTVQVKTSEAPVRIIAGDSGGIRPSVDDAPQIALRPAVE